MSYYSWFSIEADTEKTYDVFRMIPKIGTQALYAINAADKARAVPFAKIEMVKSASNKKLGVVSSIFTAPPSFGSPVQFSERPVSSIESVTVKKVNPGGYILYREIDIDIVIHRPNALADASNRPSILDLLQPGNIFLLEYGWRGGKNPVLGPGVYREEREDEYNPEELAELNEWRKSVSETENWNSSRPAGTPAREIPARPQFFGTVFTATDMVRFAVTNYNLSMEADGQVKVHIKAIEDGELQIRNTTIFDQEVLSGEVKGVPDFMKVASSPDELYKKITDTLAKLLREASESVSVTVKRNKDDRSPSTTAPMKMIRLKRVLDILFADPIVSGVKSLGYSDVHLYTGVFGAHTSDVNDSMGSRSYANEPIGDFLLKLSDVEGILNKVTSTKGQITVYNLLQHIFRLIMDPGIWDMAQRDVTMPELALYTLYSPHSGKARLQIVDRKRYLSVLKSSQGMTYNNVAEVKGKIKLSTFLNDNPFIPKFNLYHQGSFFQSANFDFVNDELMKSIFMNRSIQKSREQIAGGVPSAAEVNNGMSQNLLLYRSAIKGTATVIGNFAFHLMGMVWFEFGIPQLDGLFYILSKVDKVDASGFTSTLTFQAEGSNPLGVPPLHALDAVGYTQELFMKRNPGGTAGATTMWSMPAGSPSDFDVNPEKK